MPWSGLLWSGWYRLLEQTITTAYQADAKRAKLDSARPTSLLAPATLRGRAIGTITEKEGYDNLADQVREGVGADAVFEDCQ
jgi:hypothetical protein